MRTPPLLADFIHPIACKPKCEKLLTLPDFYIMVGTGHNGFLLSVVDWMGWWFATPPWAKEKQETISDFLPGGAAGGRLYSVLKVRGRLAR